LIKELPNNINYEDVQEMAITEGVPRGAGLNGIAQHACWMSAIKAGRSIRDINYDIRALDTHRVCLQRHRHS
jgi:hypothetical protein